MKLNKFRIQNYKSIVDTGICYLSQDLTIMAGMNESGKSSVLEAIRDFDTDRDIDSDAIRVKEDTGDPLVTLYFRLSNTDIDIICENLELANDNEETLNLKDYLSKNDIGLTKDIESNYSIDEQFKNFVRGVFAQNYKKFYTSVTNYIKKLKSFEQLANVDFSNINSKGTLWNIYQLTTSIDKIINPTKKMSVTDSTGKQIIKEVPIECDIEEEIRNSISELLNNIKEARISTFGEYYLSTFFKNLKDEVIKIIPRIIFFSSFEDILEYDVLVSQIQEKQINVDLCNIAGIEIDKLKTLIDNEEYQRVSNYLSDKSAKISSSFKSEWLQDEIVISFTTDKDLMHFGIKEEGDTATYRAEQRSKGFQWFLSFYIKLNAESNKNTSIILVDEPGLYLHAKAQEDVLHLLEKLSKADETSVIFTTHSPYLIDVDNLNRVLLVEKDDRTGTHIVKCHKGAKQDTLTPIITKMGFNISKANLIKEKNILLEGISDYYYLQAFKKILEYDDLLKNVSMIPSVGASQLPQLAALCVGWGLKYVALFDKDTEGIRNAEIVRKNLGEFASVSHICDEEDCAIEDLFSENDFNKFILKNIDKHKDDDTISNSKYLKGNNIDKVLVAKLFFDSARKIKTRSLEKTTVANFKTLYANVFTALNIKRTEDE